MTSELHKGELGRIGIIGGSLEYTGAPFYAGIAGRSFLILAFNMNLT